MCTHKTADLSCIDCWCPPGDAIEDHREAITVRDVRGIPIYFKVKDEKQIDELDRLARLAAAVEAMPEGWEIQRTNTGQTRAPWWQVYDTNDLILAGAATPQEALDKAREGK